MVAPASPVVTQPSIVIGATRIIENKGIYVLDEGELTAWRLRILVDIIRPPSIIYQSLKPNEPENYFGVFQLIEGGFVISQANIKYLHQQIYRYQNDPAKSLFDSVLLGRTLIFDLFQTGTAILNSIPASASISASEFIQGAHLATPITEIWINCANQTKLAIHTEYLPLPRIGGQPVSIPEPKADESPSAPPLPGGDATPPPESNPATPPSPPYHPSDQDNNRTTPTGVATPLGKWRITPYYAEPYNAAFPLEVAGYATDIVVVGRVGPIQGEDCTKDRYTLTNTTSGAVTTDNNCITESSGAGAPVFIP